MDLDELYELSKGGPATPPTEKVTKVVESLIPSVNAEKDLRLHVRTVKRATHVAYEVAKVAGTGSTGAAAAARGPTGAKEQAILESDATGFGFHGSATGATGHATGPVHIQDFDGSTGAAAPSQGNRTAQYNALKARMNASVVDLEAKHAKLRAKMVNYGVSVDSMAGEANLEKGWGAASHGPKPQSDGDKYRVAEIRHLAMRHNKVLELERSARENMQRAGIRNEKHLDALIARRDGKDAPVEKEEFVDPYASMEDSDLPPVDGTTAGIAIRCAEGEKLYHTGGYTVGDSELGFHQTLAFCHVIGQCSAVETAARKADHEHVLKMKAEAAAAKLQALSASIQKGVNAPSAKELKNATQTAAEKVKAAAKAEQAAGERKSALAVCVNTTEDFISTLKEQKVAQGDMRGLLKNLCLSQLVMPAHPRGITRYGAYHNCERASRVLEQVGDAPTVDDLGEYCAQVAAGDKPPVDAPPFELAVYMSDSAKLEKEEREEIAEGLQAPVEHDQGEKLATLTKKLAGRLRPRAEISDEKWDAAIKGVSSKSDTAVSSLNNIMKKLVDAKASSDQRVQKDTETLKYATDLVSGEPSTAPLGKRPATK